MIRNDYSFNNTVSMRSWLKRSSGATPREGAYSYMHFQQPGPLSPNYEKPVSPIKKFLVDLFKAVFKKAK